MSESLFTDASKRLANALKYVSISEDASERLKFPKTSLSVSIPVRLDNGSLRIFQGYRVRYDDTRGPGKGGVAIIPALPWMKCNPLLFG
jgi:glutamate dehydrogenase (NADP+)